MKKEIIVGNEPWTLSVTRNMSFWHQCMSNVGHATYLQELGIDATLRLLTLTVRGTQTSAFVTSDNYDEYTTAVLNAASVDTGLQRLRAMFVQAADRTERALEDCLAHPKSRQWRVFIDAYTRFTATLNPPLVIGRNGADRLILLLQKAGIAADDIDQTMAVITFPKEMTPLLASRIALLKIGASIQQGGIADADIKKKLAEWLDSYGHIPVNFCDDPWTESDARSQLEDILKKDCSAEIANTQKHHDFQRAAAKRRLEEIGDTEITRWAEIIAEGTYLNEYRKNVFSKISVMYRPLFTVIAKRSGSLNWRDVFYLTPQETIDVMDGVSLDLPTLVAERQVVGSLVSPQGEHTFFDQETAERVWTLVRSVYGQAHGEMVVETSALKGMSASRGKAWGVAKVILSSADFGKLSAGDILVTTMTSVDFVPIMEQAAAFVTNEGGVTCHASIVAREMNKPCIIGTKVATQILKDGDEVEVDAEKGIVTILKRA